MGECQKTGTLRWKLHRTGGMFVYSKAYPGATPLDSVVIHGRDRIVELPLPIPADLLHMVARQLEAREWTEPEVIPAAD